MSDWREEAGVTKKQAADWRDEAGVPKTKTAQLAAIIKKERAGSGKALTSDAFDNVTDVPGMARSALAGVTSNTAPYLLSRMEGVRGALTPDETYAGERDKYLPEYQNKYAKAVEEHPVANIAGAIAQPNPLGKLKAATTLGKVALAGGRVAQSAGQGALASYMGNTSPRAQDSGAGEAALAGGGIQALAEVASPVLGKVIAPALHDAAGMRALQSVGTRAGIKDALKAKGIGAAEAPALGNKMLDAGLVPTGLNPFKTPIEQTASRADALMSKSGQEVGSTLDDFMKTGRADYPRAQADMRAALPQDNAVAMSQAGKAKGLIEQVGEQGQLTPDSIHGLNKAKSTAWSATNFKDDAPLAATNYRAATGGLRGSIENQVGDELGQAAKQKLIGANQSYGVAADASDLAENAMSRDLQKMPFATTRSAVAGLMGGGVGALAAGPAGAGVGAAAGSAINHLISTRGPNLAAHGNRIGSLVSGGMGRVAGAVAPGASAATGSAIASPLQQYMNPEDEEEKKQKQAAEHFTSTMGGG